MDRRVADWYRGHAPVMETGRFKENQLAIMLLAIAEPS